MRKLTGLFVLCFLLSANALQAAEPEKVTSAAESTEISTDKEKKEKVANDGDNYKKFRFGGYGEMVASFKDYGINRFYGAPEGNPDKHRNTISIPRFVLALDYKFNSKWILGAGIPAIAWFFLLFFMYALETLVAFLQAYVFAILSASYIGLAIHPH